MEISWIDSGEEIFNFNTKKNKKRKDVKLYNFSIFATALSLSKDSYIAQIFFDGDPKNLYIMAAIIASTLVIKPLIYFMYPEYYGRKICDYSERTFRKYIKDFILIIIILAIMFSPLFLIK